MNVKIGTEAVQFPEKEYINGIFLAVHNFGFFLLDLQRGWGRLEAGPVGAHLAEDWALCGHTRVTSGGYKEMSSIFADQ